MEKSKRVVDEQEEIKEIAKTIGQNIRKFREAKKINQVNFAFKMDVSESSVSKWETGESSPRLALLGKICRYFKVTPNELFGFNEERAESDMVYIGNLNNEDKELVYKLIRRLSALN